MVSGGRKACNTIPGSPASSPEQHYQRSDFIDGNKQSAHLSWVHLCLDADLFWDLDAVWLQHQPNDGQDISEYQPGRPWSRLLEGENQPWHKDGLHPTILLRFEATILRRDVLDQLLFVVTTNLIRQSLQFQIIWKWLVLGCGEITFSAGRNSQFDGAQTSLKHLSTNSFIEKLIIAHLGIFLHAVSGETFFTVFFSSEH